MIYKIIVAITSCILTISSVHAEITRDGIIPVSEGGVISDTTGGLGLLDAMLAYIRDSIFGVMTLIAIGVFLYIGFKLIAARGNPEEFKKGLNTLIYAVIGIFIVSFAWAAVKLVAGLNI